MLYKYKTDFIIRKIIENNISCWAQLYSIIGIAGILENLDLYDVKYIYCSEELIQKFGQLIKENILKNKKNEFPKSLQIVSSLTKDAKLKSWNWDMVCYSPTTKNEYDCLCFEIEEI